MNNGMSGRTTPRALGGAIGKATAAASAAAWILLVLLTGSSIPRATFVAATLAVVLAVSAYRATAAGNVWILLVAATFGAVTPPDIGAAPNPFRYLGVLAIGYALAALFLSASWKPQ